jgi:hypothetical protein
LSILEGQSFGFYVDSVDQAFGGATLGVSNIQVFALVPDTSQNVPEPGTLALMCIAVVGLVSARARRYEQMSINALEA